MRRAFRTDDSSRGLIFSAGVTLFSPDEVAMRAADPHIVPAFAITKPRKLDKVA
jgi:hypothetical protein